MFLALNIYEKRSRGPKLPPWRHQEGPKVIPKPRSRTQRGPQGAPSAPEVAQVLRSIVNMQVICTPAGRAPVTQVTLLAPQPPLFPLQRAESDPSIIHLAAARRHNTNYYKNDRKALNETTPLRLKSTHTPPTEHSSSQQNLDTPPRPDCRRGTGPRCP